MENPFNVLIGEQLSSVIFVQDYLQLDFDGQMITYNDWPLVILPTGEYSFDNKEYRNAICSIIAKLVKCVILESNILSIQFESEERIEIHLNYNERETAFFFDADGGYSSV